MSRTVIVPSATAERVVPEALPDIFTSASKAEAVDCSPGFWLLSKLPLKPNEALQAWYSAWLPMLSQPRVPVKKVLFAASAVESLNHSRPAPLSLHHSDLHPHSGLTHRLYPRSERLQWLLPPQPYRRTHREAGRRRIQISVLPAVARLLSVSLEVLLGEEAERTPRRRGPASRLEQQIEVISRLPKARQKMVAEMLEEVVA
ncbi:hypothetical protein [Pantoea cypripedii]|uniref:hypothetical protein n=1 Tax=Pantoea cypripedii TaxID=55209 RepID=UPI001ABF29C0